MDIAHSKKTALANLAVLGALLSLAACGQNSDETIASCTSSVIFTTDIRCASIDEKPIWIKGGSFILGQEDVYPAEEGPVRETYIDNFWIDPHEVTNRQFARFAKSTGYITVAERPVDPSLFSLSEKEIPPELLLPGSSLWTCNGFVPVT